MNFWDRLKNYDLKILTPLVFSSFAFVLIQSVAKYFTNTGDDYQRILIQLTSFLIGITITGIAKVYFFYLYGRKVKLLQHKSFSAFFSKVFSEWIVVEVRVQLRVLFFLLALIVPGIIEALRLSLAPLYVFLSPKMADEEFDPVTESRKKISLGQTSVLIILFLIHAASIALGFMFVDGSFFSSGRDFSKAILNVITMTLSTYFYYIYIAHLYLSFEESQTN